MITLKPGFTAKLAQNKKNSTNLCENASSFKNRRIKWMKKVVKQLKTFFKIPIKN
jgi:hypothetical protein